MIIVGVTIVACVYYAYDNGYCQKLLNKEHIIDCTK